MRRLFTLSCAALLCFAGLQTAGAQFPTSDPRNAALKQVAEAQRTVTEAQAAVAKAEQALEGTEGEERKTAQRLLDQAQEKLTGARRELARRNTAVLNAAAEAAAARRAGVPGNVPAEREHADPHDPIERFALLAPGGPIVVQVSLTIDGQPFRLAREKLIDDMLAAADKDGDGQVRWEEALDAPRFTLGQVRSANAQAERSIKQFWDKNSDGLVDRAEVRHFLAQRFQGPTFTIGNSPSYGGRSGRAAVNGQFYTTFGAVPDILPLLDADQDGALNAGEIAAAGERLKSRDADDNDLLIPAELSDVPVAQAFRRLPQPDPPTAVVLGPAVNADSLFTLLCERYKVEHGPLPADRFPAVPELFAALDDDGDGKLQKFEAIRLNDIEPQIAITVDLSASGAGKGLSITSLAPEVAEATKEAGGDALALPGVRITMAASTMAISTVSYDMLAATYMARLDKDGNGYLDKDEGSELGQFVLWDGDGDGKVYAKEIVAAYAAMAAPQATQVVATVAQHGNPLFQLLDASGDGRLGVREMQAAAERIRLLDTEAGSGITAVEIPAMMSVSFRLGSSGGAVMQREPGAASAAPASGPEWFQRMDRNQDGDLSLREFLGDAENFRRLDTDGDSLIDPREAEAAAGRR